MDQREHAQFKELLTGYYAFKRADISRFVIELWWNAMRPYSFDAVKDAFNRHIVDPDKGQFMAQPADIVKIIDGGTVDRALLAWSKVDEAVKMIGGYQSVVFDDPAIHAAIDGMGGWMRLCETSTEKEWPFKAAEFQKRYRSAALQLGKPGFEYPRVMIGRAEADCALKNREAPPPRTIGNVEHCRLVWRGGEEGGSSQKRLGTLLEATAGNLLGSR